MIINQYTKILLTDHSLLNHQIKTFLLIISAYFTAELIIFLATFRIQKVY